MKIDRRLMKKNIWIAIGIICFVSAAKIEGKSFLMIGITGYVTMEDVTIMMNQVMQLSNGTVNITLNDVNECESIVMNECSEFEFCTNTNGSFFCTCRDGFVDKPGDAGSNCTDIDECVAADNGKCTENSRCVNLPGSFSCECNAGYMLIGNVCADIDECSSTNNCSEKAACSNTQGSYECSCKTGYTGDGLICLDIDECADVGSGNCAKNFKCLNSPGSFSCECTDRFIRNGSNCVDIDDCYLAKKCSGEEVCTQTVVNFYCRCYIDPDGQICIAINECSGSNNCSENAKCTNRADGYSCSCNIGYEGDGLNCSDIYECDVGIDDCSPYAQCTNIPGGHSCACREGYEGNGKNCTVSTTKTTASSSTAAIAPSMVALSTASTQKTSTSQAIVRVPLPELSNNTDEYIAELKETVDSLGSNYLDLDDANNTIDNFNIIVSAGPVDNITAEILVDVIDEFSHSVGAALDDTTQKNLEPEVGSKMTEFLRDMLEDMNLTTGSFRKEDDLVIVEAVEYPTTNEDISFLTNNKTEDDGAIFLPKDFIQSAQNRNKRDSHDENLRFAFTQYSDGRLFNDKHTSVMRSDKTFTGREYNNRTRIINSPVIGASIAGREIRNSSAYATIKLLKLVTRDFEIDNGNGTTSFVTYTSNPKCVWWDYTSLNWADSGCRVVEIADDYVICECNHLTSFAVIMTVGKTVDDYVLTYLSYIGSALSIAGLIWTIITYVIFRSLRNHKSKKILLHFCAALCAVYITYVLGIAANLPAYQGQCIASGFFLHYFTLSVIAWMSVEVVDMYLMFVRVMRTDVNKYMLKAGLTAWGVPFLIAIATVGTHLGLPHSDIYPEFRAGALCWLGRNGMFYGFILPSSIVLSANLILFSVVLYNITCKRNQGLINKIGQKNARNIKISQHIINAVVLLLLAGPTWIIGYFVNVDPVADGVMRRILSYIFVILNGFQGFWIFIVFAVRPPAVRKRWSALLRRGKLSEISETHSSSSSQKHTTKTTKISRPSSNLGIQEESLGNNNSVPNSMIKTVV